MIKIYLLDIKGLRESTVYKEKYSQLSEERKEKVNRIKTQKDKERSVGAGLLLQYALNQEGMKNPKIAYAKGGKPYLENANLHFNLSHSGDYVACAIADAEVGIDIQERRTNIKPIELASRFFTQEEVTELEAMVCEKRCDAFIKLWTIKESYIKYTGIGLSQGMDSFTILSDEELIMDSREKRIVHFKTFEQNGYEISVCTGCNEIPDIIEVSLNCFS